MSKLLAVLVFCLCAYAAIGAILRPTGNDRVGNLTVIRHTDYSSRIILSAHTSNVSNVNQPNGAQLIGYYGSSCNGETSKKV